MNIVRFGIPLVAWAAALFGGLQLRSIDMGHSICGPWGCGPPTASLMAMHVFWFLILAPIAIITTKSLPSSNWRSIGLGIMTIAVIAIAAIGIYDYFTFQTDYLKPVYLWQRFLFRLATLSDFPIVQLGVVGYIMTLMGRRELIQGGAELADPVPNVDSA